MTRAAENLFLLTTPARIPFLAEINNLVDREEYRGQKPGRHMSVSSNSSRVGEITFSEDKMLTQRKALLKELKIKK